MLDLINDIERMRQEIDRFLGETQTERRPHSRISFLPGVSARAYPLINVSEDRDNYYVEALAPGIQADSLDVSLSGNELSIAGEKEGLSDQTRPESVHRNERAAGRFVRNVTFNSEIEGEGVQAGYERGILKITLPKAEAAKPRQIQVRLS